MRLLKYRDQFITSSAPSIGVGVRGEYRAILYGADGREKYNSGWRPNTILNQGLQALSRADYNPWLYMYLGDSDTAVATSQTGIVGTPFSSSQSSTANTASATPTAPNYVHTTSKTATFNAGVNTGTIKEFVWAKGTNKTTDGTVRVVLDTPITKGASDQLTIEHRLYWYPETSDQTGTIDISGTSYDYTMRHSNITTASGSHLSYIVPTQSALFQTHAVSQADIAAITTAPAYWADMTYSSVSYGSVSSDSWYADTSFVMGVDNANGTHGSYVMGIGGGKYFQVAGIQFKLVETADGVTTITKANTHVLTLNCRVFVNRHVP